MSEITVRYIETHRGDTLQTISLREMGDSGFWHDLVWLNDLIPPFVTDDPLLAGPRVVLSGEKIAIPTSGTGVDPDEIETFGVDISLSSIGKLSDVDGDFQTESGYQNLKMALLRRIVVEKQELGFSPGYGCWVGLIRGEKLGAAQLALAAFYVKSSILEDDRVSDVLSCVAVADGDSIKINATVQPVDGKELSLGLVI